MSAVYPGLRLPRRTVRLRLTLLYVALFLASAACLLVITYLLVERALPQLPQLVTNNGGTAVSTSAGVGTGTGTRTGTSARTGISGSR
jgi:hypothetical protein